MIKVLHIISDMNIGGAGHYLLNLLHSHDSSKFAVSIAMPRGSKLKERFLPFGISVHEVDCLTSKSFEISAVKKLSRLIRDVDPDIVHTHAALSGRIASKRCGKHVVFTRHSGFAVNPFFTKGIGKFFYKAISERYSDRIIACSNICRDDLISCGVSDSMIDVVLNGSPPIPKETKEQCFELRKEHGFSPDDFLAGIVARIEPYKGQMFVVEAARILKDEGHRIRIIIAGTGSYEDEVKKRAKELDLGDTIIFTGFVNDVASLFNILDVQINASYVEATSLSLLEGMSIGLPAVASVDGGNPWIIQDNVNGLLFKSRDSISLAACIARLNSSPELVKKLSSGALEIYNSKFTCDIFAGNTEATYLKAMERNELQHGK